MFKKLFSRTPKKTYQVVLRSLGRTIEVPEGKTVLDAALDAGIPYPHSCCAAECATCLSLLVSGSIREEVDTCHLIGPAQKQAGYFLACQAQSHQPTRWWSTPPASASSCRPIRCSQPAPGSPP